MKTILIFFLLTLTVLAQGGRSTIGVPRGNSTNHFYIYDSDSGKVDIVADNVFADSLMPFDSISIKAGSDSTMIRPTSSIGGNAGIIIQETVVVEETEAGSSPSFGIKADGNISDIVPPGNMTSSWDWTLPNQNGTFVVTPLPSDSAGLSAGSLYFLPADGIIRRKY